MTRITQPGVHPDTESLNAFVEQVLPLPERGQILEHLAYCDRCRQVVFLVQKASSLEVEAPPITPSAEPAPGWEKWFAGWRWTWVPAAALAGIVGLAVLHHYRNVPAQMEVAQSVPRAPAPTGSSTSQPLSSPNSAQLSNTRPAGASSPESKDTPVTAKRKPESPHQGAAIRESNKTMKESEAVAIEPSQPVQAQSYQGEARPAQKPSDMASQRAIGGPYAANNASQQQASNQPLSSPNSAQLSNTRPAVASSSESKETPVTAKRKPESPDHGAAIRDSNKTMKESEAVAIEPSHPVQAQSYKEEARPPQKPSDIASQRSIGGPYAANNASQQQASNQQEIAKDQLHSARYSAKAAGVGGTVGATTNVSRADAQSPAYPAAAAVAPARQTTVQAETSNLVASADESLFDKKSAVVLPNGMRALSVATAQSRTVAIDPSGSMFLNEAPGGQWIPVAMQWTGRAVLIRTIETQLKAKAASQPMLFELVNDKNETWMSSDGKTWVPKAH